MAKLAVAALFLVGLLTIVQASSFRTVVTVVEEEAEQGSWESQGSQQQRCQRQIQQQYQQLQSCKRHMQQKSNFEIDMVVDEGQQEHLRQCCQSLKNVGPQCGCEALRQVVQETCQQVQGGQGGQWGQGGQQGQQQQQQVQQKMQQILEKARNIPKECNMGQQQCPVESACKAY